MPLPLPSSLLINMCTHLRADARMQVCMCVCLYICRCMGSCAGWLAGSLEWLVGPLVGAGGRSGSFKKSGESKSSGIISVTWVSARKEMEEQRREERIETSDVHFLCRCRRGAFDGRGCVFVFKERERGDG